MKTPTDRRKGIYVGKPLKELADVLWWPTEQQSKDIHSNHTVIKLNGIYVETVDDGYSNRGIGAMTGLVLGGIALFGTLLMSWLEIRDGNFPLFFLVVGSPVIVASFFIARHDCFAYTHYPIRYNRRNRTVYSWRPDGKTIKIKWDDLCFFPSRPISPITNEWIVGAVMQPGKKTVEDIFIMGMFNGSKSQQKMYVEFFRHFMEQGPQAVVNEKSFLCLPRLDRQREGWWFGWKKLMLLDNGWPLLQLIWMPYITIQSLFRWIAMRTSKIPVWPEWVETECQADADDPWARDITTNPK